MATTQLGPHRLDQRFIDNNNSIFKQASMLWLSSWGPQFSRGLLGGWGQVMNHLAGVGCRGVDTAGGQGGHRAGADCGGWLLPGRSCGAQAAADHQAAPGRMHRLQHLARICRKLCSPASEVMWLPQKMMPPLSPPPFLPSPRTYRFMYIYT